MNTIPIKVKFGRQTLVKGTVVQYETLEEVLDSITPERIVDLINWKVKFDASIDLRTNFYREQHKAIPS